MSELYSKDDLSRVFGDALNKHPGDKDLLVELWSSIKKLDDKSGKPTHDCHTVLESNKDSKDLTKAFSYECALYIYMLMTDCETLESDNYWSEVCIALGKLCNKYGAETLAGQWATALLFAADDIVTGKRIMRGQDRGRLWDRKAK